MTKNKVSKTKKFRMSKRLNYFLLVFASLAIVTLAATLIPVDTLKTGSCSSGGQTIRLSLFSDGMSRMKQAKLEDKQSDRKREEFLKNSRFAMGCSIGPVYKLYLF